MKVVRYAHFEPLDWVVAVGSYENEFFAQAESLRSRMRSSQARHPGSSPLEKSSTSRSFRGAR